MITVGATLNEYRGDSWPVGYDSEFNVRSQNNERLLSKASNAYETNVMTETVTDTASLPG